MPSHPSFRKFDLPNSPILRDEKNKNVTVVPLHLHGHRKTTMSVQTLKFASGRRPGHHTWFRKRVSIIEVVTYTIYDGDHDELTTDTDDTDFDDGNSNGNYSDGSTPPLTSSSMPPSDEGTVTAGNAALFAAADASVAEDVRQIWARIYADADMWAASALQAIAPAAQSQAQAGQALPATGNTHGAHHGQVIRIPGARVLGSTLSAAIVISSDEESDMRASKVAGPSSLANTGTIAAPAAIGETSRAGVKRGVTLQGGVAGPPVKKAKTAAAASKAT